MKEKITLKSMNPEQYEDITIECRVLTQEEIGAYIKEVPEERKITAYKSAPVVARPGVPGEVIKSVLVTYIDGKAYLLNEEEVAVKPEGGVVVTNINSTSNEQYVVKTQKFADTYTQLEDGTYAPLYEERQLIQVQENIIFPTAWGAPALCLKGSFVVIYDLETCDFNSLELGAMQSTYTVVSGTPTLKQ